MLPADERDFLVLSSFLDKLSGPLCDEVLGRTGSAEMLDALEASNRFIVSLDRERSWYRYHHLFREMLQRELDQVDPAERAQLMLRASNWCAEHELLDAAVDHAMVANSPETVVEYLRHHGLRLYAKGRLDVLRAWFDWLADEPSVDGGIAVLGAWFHLEAGRAAEAEACDEDRGVGTAGRRPA